MRILGTEDALLSAPAVSGKAQLLARDPATEIQQDEGFRTLPDEAL